MKPRRQLETVWDARHPRHPRTYLCRRLETEHTINPSPSTLNLEPQESPPPPESQPEAPRRACMQEGMKPRRQLDTDVLISLHASP
jgi:hypothetical protein